MLMDFSKIPRQPSEIPRGASREDTTAFERRKICVTDVIAELRRRFINHNIFSNGDARWYLVLPLYSWFSLPRCFGWPWNHTTDERGLCTENSMAIPPNYEFSFIGDLKNPQQIDFIIQQVVVVMNEWCQARQLPRLNHEEEAQIISVLSRCKYHNTHSRSPTQ